MTCGCIRSCPRTLDWSTTGYCAACPFPQQVSPQAAIIEQLSNLYFGSFLLCEGFEYLSDHLKFIGWTWTRMTRSVWMLFCWPRESISLAVPSMATNCRRKPYPAGPPCLYPNSIRRHCPAKTFTDSSLLYSPAIVRLTLLIKFEIGLPSFSNCSAQ